MHAGAARARVMPIIAMLAADADVLFAMLFMFHFLRRAVAAAVYS